VEVTSDADAEDRVGEHLSVNAIEAVFFSGFIQFPVIEDAGIPSCQHWRPPGTFLTWFFYVHAWAAWQTAASTCLQRLLCASLTVHM
jgi:hypothetical protein